MVSIMDINLSDRFVLVTGGSKGIGFAAAKACAKHGATPIVLASGATALDAAVSQLRRISRETEGIRVDLKDMTEVEQVADIIDRNFGALHTFIGNACIAPDVKPLNEITATEWQTSLTANVAANAVLLQTLDPMLTKADQGRVIFVSSKAALNPIKNWGVYGVVKAGLENLAKSYALEHKGDDTRVHIVDPGGVNTEFQERFTGKGRGKTLPKPDGIAEIFVELADPANDTPSSRFKAQDRNEAPAVLLG